MENKTYYTVRETNEDGITNLAWKLFDNYEDAEVFMDYQSNLYPMCSYEIESLLPFTEKDKETIYKNQIKMGITIAAEIDKDNYIEEITIYPQNYKEYMETKYPEYRYTINRSNTNTYDSCHCSVKVLIDRDKIPKGRKEIVNFFIETMKTLTNNELIFKEIEI